MRIASYNVRDLFDEETAALSGGVAKPAKALQALAGTLGMVAADVVLLQEVGSRQILTELNEMLAHPFPFVKLLRGNSDRGIHLGIVSREPIELTSHQTLELVDEAGDRLLEYRTEADALAGNAAPLRIQRDLMLAELQLADEKVLALFNVHLKSKTNRSWRQLAADVVRAAEARLVARLVADYLSAHPDRPLILGGDFNDLRSSEVLQSIFSLPLGDPLGDALASNGRNPSTYWPKRKMRLDYLLLSDRAGQKLVSDSAVIHASARARRASDHYPISVDLAFSD